MRKFAMALGLLAGLQAASGAFAQDTYPSRPISIVVPFTAGGGADLLARQAADAMAAKLGSPVLVDNRPGGGTLIGTRYVQAAKPDGYTLMLASNSFTINGILAAGEKIDPTTVFEPISYLADNTFVLVVHPDSGITSVEQLLEKAKADPGGLTYGSTGAKTGSDLAFRIFMKGSGAEFTHIPYNGATPANVALMGGEVDTFMGVLAGMFSYLKDGSMIPLAVTADTRSAALPDVPTLKELGIDMNFSAWFGLVAPKGTPQPIIDQLSKTVREMYDDPEVRRKIEALGNNIRSSTGAELNQHIAIESALVGSLASTFEE